MVFFAFDDGFAAFLAGEFSQLVVGGDAFFELFGAVGAGDFDNGEHDYYFTLSERFEAFIFVSAQCSEMLFDT